MKTTDKKFVICKNNTVIDDSRGYGYTKEEAIARLSEFASMENFSDYFEYESAREYVLEKLNEIAEYEEREVTEEEIQEAMKWYESDGWYHCDGEPFLFCRKDAEYYSIGAESYSIEEMDYVEMGLGTKWTSSNAEDTKKLPKEFRCPTKEEVNTLFAFSEVSFDEQSQECVFRDTTRLADYPVLRIPINKDSAYLTNDGDGFLITPNCEYQFVSRSKYDKHIVRLVRK